MPTIFESCQELFETDDLYAALGVRKEASAEEVKRAYYKRSLKVHPDKVPESEREDATRKFQFLSQIYSILSEEEKRKLYDETGTVDDSCMYANKDWYTYWRLLYNKISVEDIKEYEQKYKGSAEEMEDLKVAYLEYEGDMDLIMNSIICSTVEDEERLREILLQKIKKGELPNYTAFSSESNRKKKTRKRKAKQEAKEAEELSKQLGITCDSSVKALIQKKCAVREDEMNSFLANLESKYAAPKKKCRSKKPKTKKEPLHRIF